MDTNVKNRLDWFEEILDQENERIKRECELIFKTCEDLTVHDRKTLREAAKTYMSLYKLFRLNYFDVIQTSNYIESFGSKMPLTPIIDDPQDWVDLKIIKKGVIKKEYCKRCPRVFRETYEDGTVIYRDNERVTGIDYILGTHHHFGLCNLVYDEMFPITLPYKVGSENVKFYFYPFLSNREDQESEFDTSALLFIEKSDGEQIPVNRYFRVSNEGEEPDIGGWVEIDVEELEERIKASKSNLELVDLCYKLGDDIIVCPDGKLIEEEQ